MHPYKVSVIPRLYAHDLEPRLTYCGWFTDHFNNDVLILFSDEAWFHLFGHINSKINFINGKYPQLC